MADEFDKIKELNFPDAETEHFALINFELTPHDISMIHLREAINPRLNGENHNISAGRYTKLVQKNGDNKSWWDTVMANTPMEFDTNRAFVQNAKGDVLIAGLGMGLIVIACQDKPEVKSITIVEKNKEVIDLVTPHIPLSSKVKIIHSDIFLFKTKEKFDTIYFDIWNNICSDEWEGIKKLKRRFRHNLNMGGWLGVWREDDFRAR